MANLFLTNLEAALIQALAQSQKVVAKSQFWHTYRHTSLNPRQVVMISKLWDGFMVSSPPKNGRGSQKYLQILL